MSQHSVPHPFDPLTKSEISQSSQLIRNCFPKDAVFDFRSVSLYEPEKSEMVSFLEAEHAGVDLSTVKRPTRQARVVYYLGNNVCVMLTRFVFFFVLNWLTVALPRINCTKASSI